MPRTQKPNVVFFIVDDTDHRYLGCWDGIVPTPNLDRLTRRGVRLDRAFCTSAICQPSRYSYMTGRYAGSCPDPVFLRSQPRAEAASVEFNVYLNHEIPSQGFLFADAGYRTGFAGKWHVGHPVSMLDVPEFDTDADPDDPEVEAKLRELHAAEVEEIRRTGGFGFAGGVIWGNNGNWPLKALNDHHIEWSMQAALDFLDDCPADEPFMLHYGSTCTHGPSALAGLDRDWRYTPGGKMDPRPEPLPDRRTLPDRLREMDVEVNDKNVFALWIDDQVGGILDKLEEKGVLDETVFVFCSDHNIEPAKSTCYEQGINVPLIISAPGLLPQGAISGALASNIDLMPTLLSLCGIERPPGVQFDGVDLSAVLRGDTNGHRDALFFEVGYLRAVRTERWKYIALRFPERVIGEMRRGERDEAPNHMDRRKQPHAQIAMEHYPGYYDPDQLYDLEADPGEMNNLADDPEHTDRLAVLRNRLRAFLEAQPHPYPLDEKKFLESEEFRRLAEKTRAIGTDYISWWNG